MLQQHKFTPEEDYKQGQTLLQKGKLKPALNEFLMAINKAPRNFQYLTAAAHVKLKLGQKESALSLYKDAALIQPEDPIAQSDLALCHLSMGQYAKALASFKNAAKLDEANAQHGYNVAKCHSKMGNLRAGFNEYRKHCNPLSSLLYTVQNSPIRYLPLMACLNTAAIATLVVVDRYNTPYYHTLPNSRRPIDQKYEIRRKYDAQLTYLVAATFVMFLFEAASVLYDTCNYLSPKITHLAREGKESFVKKYEKATGLDKEPVLPTRI